VYAHPRYLQQCTITVLSTPHAGNAFRVNLGASYHGITWSLGAWNRMFPQYAVPLGGCPDGSPTPTPPGTPPDPGDPTPEPPAEGEDPPASEGPVTGPQDPPPEGCGTPMPVIRPVDRETGSDFGGSTFMQQFSEPVLRQLAAPRSSGLTAVTDRLDGQLVYRQQPRIDLQDTQNGKRVTVRHEGTYSGRLVLHPPEVSKDTIYGEGARVDKRLPSAMSTSRFTLLNYARTQDDVRTDLELGQPKLDGGLFGSRIRQDFALNRPRLQTFDADGTGIIDSPLATLADLTGGGVMVDDYVSLNMDGTSNQVIEGTAFRTAVSKSGGSIGGIGEGSRKSFMLKNRGDETITITHDAEGLPGDAVPIISPTGSHYSLPVDSFCWLMLDEADGVYEISP
jgi:hypothetical protein